MAHTGFIPGILQKNQNTPHMMWTSHVESTHIFKHQSRLIWGIFMFIISTHCVINDYQWLLDTIATLYPELVYLWIPIAWNSKWGECCRTHVLLVGFPWVCGWPLWEQIAGLYGSLAWSTQTLLVHLSSYPEEPDPPPALPMVWINDFLTLWKLWAFTWLIRKVPRNLEKELEWKFSNKWKDKPVAALAATVPAEGIGS